jgi:carbamate kinase
MNDIVRPKRLVVVALGGNALIKPGQRGTTEEHEENARETAEYLWELVDRGHNLIITHGNGPQVGDIMLRSDIARDKVPPNPLDVCVAESEGAIGYYLQQALLNKLRRKHNKRFVVTVITQVLVDEQDPAFENPSKPVGPFYTGEQAKKLMAENPKWAMVEDSGRGWRRVVPSPIPKQIVQRYMIRDSAKRGHIVIALGGGGIPIARDHKGDYVGVEAVIDKDLASSNLACELDADLFIMLMPMEKVCLKFNTPEQEDIDLMTVEEAAMHLKSGEFAPGSMAPKIQAAIEYITTCQREVIITSADKLQASIDGKTGTRIIPTY